MVRVMNDVDFYIELYRCICDLSFVGGGGSRIVLFMLCVCVGCQHGRLHLYIYCIVPRDDSQSKSTLGGRQGWLLYIYIYIYIYTSEMNISVSM